MENPKTPSTLSTQGTDQRQTKQNNTENRIDKQHGPHRKPGVNKGARKGIQFLLLIWSDWLIFIV
jgi:hypothetical protein